MKLRLRNNAGAPLTGSYPYVGSKSGNLELDENGEAEIELKHGESITISKLPLNVTYTIFEIDDDTTSEFEDDTDRTVGTEGTITLNEARATLVSLRENANENDIVATLTVKYLEKDTNKVLAEQINITGKVDDSYSTEKKNITDYKFVDMETTDDLATIAENKNTSGKLTKDAIIVIYYYEKIEEVVEPKPTSTTTPTTKPTQTPVSTPVAEPVEPTPSTTPEQMKESIIEESDNKLNNVPNTEKKVFPTNKFIGVSSIFIGIGFIVRYVSKKKNKRKHWLKNISE